MSIFSSNLIVNHMYNSIEHLLSTLHVLKYNILRTVHSIPTTITSNLPLNKSIMKIFTLLFAIGNKDRLLYVNYER